jgi:alkylation response protein AidB-like acyl-CoA dehydrogenase
MQKFARVDEYLVALQTVAPLVAEFRESFDHERRLPDRVFDALADAGLFRLWLPEALGGPQLSPFEFMTVVEAAAALDGSIGWLVGNGGGMSRAGAFVTEGIARKWFDQPRAFIVASTGAVGEAIAVDGGYLVSGRWPFGSGAPHATVFMGLANVSGQSTQISCYMDREAVVVHDTWNVSGLRATGSYNFEAREVFVPKSNTHHSSTPEQFQPGAIYRLPVGSMFAWTVACVPLGIARGAISTFAKLAAAKKRQATTAMLRDRETVQKIVGQAEAMHGAARAFLIDTMMELIDVVEVGSEPTLRARAVFRAACTNAGESAVRIVQLLAAEAGAVSIFESCPLERAVRDVHAASHHIAMTPNNYVLLGRIGLGLEPEAARI